ncbi:MaoC family dehydratase N-terminal domain-containing protein [Tumebacillus flagellatus]|uniref:Dehydratase n=1 Tax=Tumebacillus flagellatus TaxID=1157490 RepID=A0A074LNG7_9BACL|nr:MaoC family dehydratase N-terminal domain-containing protein [Tumebacillus flagellatus]KEO82619.1 dehydratase [Tumebacillus flagellatus]
MQRLAEIVGQSSTPVANDVERGAIRKFAEAIGDPNPLYRTGDASGRVVAPPTFSLTLDHGKLEGFDLKTDGLIHGEQEFNYGKPMYAGDVISSSMKVTDVYEKTGKSGKMTFVTLEQTGINQHGETCYHNIMKIIIR